VGWGKSGVLEHNETRKDRGRKRKKQEEQEQEQDCAKNKIVDILRRFSCLFYLKYFI